MTAQWLSDMGGQAASLLILLVAGHVFGDFLFQSRRVAREKERKWGAMLTHALTVFGVHCAVLWPFLSGGVALGVLCLSVLHLIVDVVRSRAVGTWGASLGGFFADQALHLVSIFVLWRVLVAWDGGASRAWSPQDDWLLWYARWSLVAAAYVFNAKGGTRVVRGVLKRFPRTVPQETEDGESEYEMGRWIGNLERFLVLTFALSGQWAAMGLIIAAKSIARFPELTAKEHKDFAEYYLIGTLTSVLVALASGMAIGMTVLWPS